MPRLSPRHRHASHCSHDWAHAPPYRQSFVKLTVLGRSGAWQRRTCGNQSPQHLDVHSPMRRDGCPSCSQTMNSSGCSALVTACTNVKHWRRTLGFCALARIKILCHHARAAHEVATHVDSCLAHIRLAGEFKVEEPMHSRVCWLCERATGNPQSLDDGLGAPVARERAGRPVYM